MIILASKSTTRQKLLQDAGVVFETRLSHHDEALEETSDQSPKDIAQNLATQKAIIVSKQHLYDLIIGCDQTLECENRLLIKPTTREEAAHQLRLLRGKPHHLHTAIAIAQNDQIIWQHCVTVSLTMRNFSDAFLDTYLDSIPSDIWQSTGCYQIEGRGIQLFDTIDGDHHSILGLPLIPLLSYLRGSGHIPS
jgi:septum formation protein